MSQYIHTSPDHADMSSKPAGGEDAAGVLRSCAGVASVSPVQVHITNGRSPAANGGGERAVPSRHADHRCRGRRGWQRQRRRPVVEQEPPPPPLVEWCPKILATTRQEHQPTEP
jgi:hypothetical protein